MTGAASRFSGRLSARYAGMPWRNCFCARRISRSTLRSMSSKRSSSRSACDGICRLLRDTAACYVHVAAHAARRESNLRLGCRFEVALCAGLDEILQRSRERVALAKILGLRQGSAPCRIAHGERQRATLAIEHAPVTGDDGTENLLRMLQLLLHDAVQLRGLIIG